MKKELPKDITSYDLLKTLAVVLMIIDHIGYYFFPEQLWWRAAGRLSAPIWLFLIGHAKTRDIPVNLWGGAVLLVIASFFLKAHFFPLNILLSFIIIRLTLDKIATKIFTNKEAAVIALFLFPVLYLPTYIAIDYGILGILIALFGYAVRTRTEKTTSLEKRSIATGLLACLLYIVAAMSLYDFNALQKCFVVLSCTAVFGGLFKFKPKTFPRLSKNLPAPLVKAMQFGGRRTLEIYIVHVIAFMLAAWALGVEGFGFLKGSWF